MSAVTTRGFKFSRSLVVRSGYYSATVPIFVPKNIVEIDWLIHRRESATFLIRRREEVDGGS